MCAIRRRHRDCCTQRQRSVYQHRGNFPTNPESGTQTVNVQVQYQPHHLHKNFEPKYNSGYSQDSNSELRQKSSTNIRWTARTLHQVTKGPKLCAQSAVPGTRYQIKQTLVLNL